MSAKVVVAKVIWVALKLFLLLAILHFMFIIGAAKVMKKLYDWAELRSVGR